MQYAENPRSIGDIDGYGVHREWKLRFTLLLRSSSNLHFRAAITCFWGRGRAFSISVV
jgi:hypothetical protein